MNVNDSEFVGRRVSFVFWFLWNQTSGKPYRFQHGGFHESKLQLELKVLVDIHPQST